MSTGVTAVLHQVINSCDEIHQFPWRLPHLIIHQRRQRRTAWWGCSQRCCSSSVWWRYVVCRNTSRWRSPWLGWSHSDEPETVMVEICISSHHVNLLWAKFCSATQTVYSIACSAYKDMYQSVALLAVTSCIRRDRLKLQSTWYL